MNQELNILLAERNELIREGFKSWISRFLDHMVVHKEVIYGEDAFREGQRAIYSLIILDNHFPDMKGLEVAIKLREIGVTTPILLLSRLKDEKIISRIQDMGINGVIPRDVSVKQFLEAVNIIVEGDYYHAKEHRKVEKPLCETLSERERQVFYMLGRGYRCSEIARKFNLSRGSVDTYRKRIFEKMGFDSNIELIRYLVKNDLDTKPLTMMLSEVE